MNLKKTIQTEFATDFISCFFKYATEDWIFPHLNPLSKA